MLMTRIGTLYLYGSWRKYVDLCWPLGLVTRRASYRVLIEDHSLAMCNLVKIPLNARYEKDKKSCGEFAIKMACSKLGENPYGKITF